MAGGRLFHGVACAWAVALCAFAVPAAADTFAPNSYVEQDLAPDAPIDPNSATMVQRVVNEVDHGMTLSNPQKPNVDYQWCAPRVYTVSAAQPPVHVNLPSDASPALKEQLEWVPIPPYANTVPATACGDRPLVIWQPSTNTVWDMWVAGKDALGQWSARYGGKIGASVLKPQLRNVAQNPGHWEDPPFGYGRRFGTAATSIPKISGLPRISEIQAGLVDHVINIQLGKPGPCWRWPAQRMDGIINSTLNDPAAPPYGSILRLPADLNIDAMNISRFTKAIAKGAQKHGMVVNDRGRVGFGVEVPPRLLGEPGHANDPDPYVPYFDGRSGPQIVDEFPWEQLQVLAPRPGTQACQTQ